MRNVVYWPAALSGSLLMLTEANLATYVMRVGMEANVFTGCTGFSLGKSLVTLWKKIRFARMFSQRLGSLLSYRCWVWIPTGIFVGLSSPGAFAGTVPGDKPETYLLI